MKKHKMLFIKSLLKNNDVKYIYLIDNEKGIIAVDKSLMEHIKKSTLKKVKRINTNDVKKYNTLLLYL